MPSYPERIVTLGICEHVDHYLLLRIADEWKYCPRDWDFVIATFSKPDRSPYENAVISVEYHTGLGVRLLSTFQPFRWADEENRIVFVLHPFLFRVKSRQVRLSSKFSAAKWVRLNHILAHDRQDYLVSVLENTLLRGLGPMRADTHFYSA